ncbi:MAG: hypothetical protein M1817_006537 [Caeruleum heppii]|nr:MAG: hypothetical protein M1817_006537 [Caeruleum heppii]
MPSTLLPPSTLSELRTNAHLLQLIYHRNKNQHRRSTWWKWLSQLRRHMARLLTAHDAYEAALTISGHVGDPATHSRRRVGIGSMVDRKMKIGREVEGRVRWLRGVVVPRCWGAFSTSLLADTQFVALGLVLIGIVARIAKLLGGVEPLESLSHDSTENSLEERRGVGMEGAGLVSVEEHGADEEDEEEWGGFGDEEVGLDRGILVQREADEDMEDEAEREPAMSLGLGGGVDLDQRSAATVLHEEIGNGESDEEGRKRKRRKRKKGAGDAIDDLFSGLV